MVREVDKIVANLLIAEGAVCISGMGSLRVVRHGARRVSARKIEPPSRCVEFSSQPVGTLLTDAIARAAGCDVRQAQDICDRWLAQVQKDGVLAIGGVGALRDKGFEMESAFDRLLNPQGHEPVPLRGRRNHWFLWTVAGVAIACGLGVCGWILYDRCSESGCGAESIFGRGLTEQNPNGTAAALPEERAEAAPADNADAAGETLFSASGNASEDFSGAPAGRRSGVVGAVSGRSEDAASGRGPSAPERDGGSGAATGTSMDGAEAVGSEIAAGTQGRATAGTSGIGAEKVAGSVGGTKSGPRSADVAAPHTGSGEGLSGTRSKTSEPDLLEAQRLVSGRTYVVLGVYSSLENARRAVRDAVYREPALNCRIYHYGSKYMVSMCAAETPEAGAAFVRAYSNRFPDMWTYRAR